MAIWQEPHRKAAVMAAMILAMTLLLAIGILPVKASAGTADQWDLVFEDDFTGTSVDTTKWNIEDWPSDRNQELQYYAPDDVYIENGNLVLRSQKRTYTIPPGKKGEGGTREYTSGAVNTLNRYNLTYGKVEVRGKVPKSQGYWPAIWLNAVSGWPPEFDIIEFLGHEPNVLHTNNHWGKYPNNGQVGGAFKGTVDLSEDFHVYGFEWDPGEIRYYLDDVLVRTYTYNGKLYKNGSWYDAISNEPMYLILNTAIGGSWPGSPDETSVFPQEFKIDYVKMYKRSADSKVLENLAKSKSASGNNPVWEGNEANKATDNNSNTFWYPMSGTVQELTVDLGQVYSNVNGTEISWDSAGNYPYKIDVSADGAVWSTVKDRTQTSGSPMVQTNADTFQPVNARYVRLTINKALAGVMEIKVFNGALTDPPSPPVVETPRLPSRMTEDPYNNLTRGAASSVFFERSDGWSLVTNTPQFMDGDASRAQRSQNTMKWLTYKVQDVKTFELTAYAWGSTADTGIFAGKTKIFASPDNVNWTELELSYNNGSNNNSWYRAVIAPKTPLPEGSLYYKIELHPTDPTQNDTWKYCLGNISFVQDNVLTDPLNESSSQAALAHSANWSLVTDNPGQFKNDPGRWSPSDGEAAYIVYNRQDIHDFEVTLFSRAGGSDVLEAYTSPDGVSWSKLAIVGSDPDNLADSWLAASFSPAEALPYKADYLKIALAGGAGDSRAQLSQFKLHYGIPQPQKEQAAPVKPLKTGIADRGTPVIDGEVEGIWNGTQTLVTDRRKSRLPGPSSAAVKTLWDESYLYVLADVKDPAVVRNSPISYGDWDEDCVEIYVDEDHQKNITYDSNDFQYRVNYEGKLSASAGIEAVVRPTETGYLVEAKIPFKSLTASQGKVIGFDIQVSDDPGTGHRQYIASWNSEDERQSASMFTIGDLVLGPAKPPLAPAVSGITLDSSRINLSAGQTYQARITSLMEITGPQSVVSYVYGPATGQISFASSNPQIASVYDTGLIVAHAAGETVVMATYGGKSASAAVTVLPSEQPIPDPVPRSPIVVASHQQVDDSHSNYATNVLSPADYTGTNTLHWAASGTAWISMYLGESAKVVNGVQLGFVQHEIDTRYYKLKIDYSADGQNWSAAPSGTVTSDTYMTETPWSWDADSYLDSLALNAASAAEPENTLQSFIFDEPVEARFIRIAGDGNVTGASSDEWNRYWRLRPVFSSSMSAYAPPAEVSVTGSDFLYPGGSVQLLAHILPESATVTDVIWSSSDPSVASVNSEGWVTAMSEGNVSITTTTADGQFISAGVFQQASDTHEITITAISTELSTLSLSAGELSPAFASGITSYASSVPYGVSTLSATANADRFSTITVNGNPVASGQASDGILLNTGSNTLSIVVTAPDGTTKTYRVIVYREFGGDNGHNGFTTNGSGVPATGGDGKMTLPAGQAGEVSLGSKVTVSVPAGSANKELRITITQVADSQGLLRNHEIPLSPVFEIVKNIPENFSKPITLTFMFDPSILKDKQTAAVFYYDEARKAWIEVDGGTIHNNRISVTVDHLTKFAVFAVNTPAVQPAPAVRLSDIAGHWAEAFIRQAVSAGIVSGYPDGAFKPDRMVTRAEFTVMLMNALKPQSEGAALDFTDAAEIGEWAQAAVAQAVKAGIVSGYEDGSFRPDATVTRAEIAVMLAGALGLEAKAEGGSGFADEHELPEWSKGAIEALKRQGFVEGKEGGRYDPTAPATRGEAAKLLSHLVNWQGRL